MKKICMIVPSPDVKGGIASVVNGYRGSLLEENYQIIFVESYQDGTKVRKFFKAICGYIHFIKVLVFNDPDIIHIHSSFGPSFYRKIPFIYMATWCKKPIINHIHGAEFVSFYTNASNRKKKLIRKVYQKCSILIALSAEWKEKLLQITPNGRIAILENYSILQKSAMEERLKRECNNIILFLGELGKRKGCYDIPQVAKRVLDMIPDATFILAGKGTPEDERNIKQAFIDLGITSHIIFPGWVRGEAKDQLLKSADIFFLPSYNEGMPMSILDAMGYGLPIVSTNVGGIPKLVTDKNGICCDAGDITSMSCQIIKILKNEKIRRQCSQASYQIVEEQYSLEKHIEKLKSIYENI